jgi:hypothetical protein
MFTSFEFDAFPFIHETSGLIQGWRVTASLAGVILWYEDFTTEQAQVANEARNAAQVRFAEWLRHRLWGDAESSFLSGLTSDAPTR